MHTIKPEKIITTISNLKTGEVYKTEDEWKAKGVPETEIRRDVKVIMPSLDLFPKTKQKYIMGFLKKLGQKAKGVVRKIVPKELSGIMRVAAPFVSASNPLAGIGLSVAGQLRSERGRINPLETVLAAAPSRQFRDLTKKIPGGSRFDEFLYGTAGSTSPAFETLPSGGVKGVVDVVRKPERGILGIGGKFNPFKGSIIFDKDNKPKLGNIIGLIGSGLSFLDAKKAIRREGEDLGLDDDEIDNLEGQLLDTYFPGFDPTGFRPDVPGRKDGGLMRKNFNKGSELPPDPTKPIGVPPGFKPKPIGPVLPNKAEAVNVDILRQMFMEALKNGEIPPGTDFDTYKDMMMTLMSKTQAKKGGLMRTNFALGTMPTKEESGLGGLPIEADMRYTGGFMPYGAKEKADDVPARLSKNEFVFTADAVRAAGGGNIQKGAQRMYNTMKQLESMGRMS